MPDVVTNPAKVAAEEAWAKLKDCLDQGESFIFEAGAGAGKTYSLVQALRYLVDRNGTNLIRNRQQVACITYTNVATKEIETRTDGHPAIYSATIHSFCWTLIQGFQPFLRNEIPKIAGWPERLKESAQRLINRNGTAGVAGKTKVDPDQIAGIEGSSEAEQMKLESVGSRKVEYNLGHPRAETDSISLGHNDVLVLAARLCENEKFRRLLSNRFPIVFVDEYQDTDNLISSALNTYLIGSAGSPLIGFFGDHWQKIYGTGCGKIENPKLKPIGKKANFRSVPAIVDCLNRMRPELPQEVEDPTAVGSVVVFHTNEWKGERRKGGHWGGDLPEADARLYFQAALRKLAHAGWDFSPAVSKVLMLTHNAIATEHGYKQLLDCFEYRDSAVKKEDPHISFLMDTVEPACRAFANKRYGELSAVLGERTQLVRAHANKAAWSEHLNALVRLTESGSIGAVIDHIRRAQLFPIPESVERKERFLEKRVEPIAPETLDEIERLRSFRSVPYKQLVALKDFIEEKTPFATKHGVKGAEFENVLVVVGRGWNQYNFVRFLEGAGKPTAEADRETYERNRNLFYVACSRPKKRLALLFTQELSGGALKTLENWFGGAVVHPLSLG